MVFLYRGVVRADVTSNCNYVPTFTYMSLEYVPDADPFVEVLVDGPDRAKPMEDSTFSSRKQVRFSFNRRFNFSISSRCKAFVTKIAIE